MSGTDIALAAMPVGCSVLRQGMVGGYGCAACMAEGAILTGRVPPYPILVLPYPIPVPPHPIPVANIP
eukprot:463059-Rhodomonas_salina.2